MHLTGLKGAATMDTGRPDWTPAHQPPLGVPPAAAATPPWAGGRPGQVPWPGSSGLSRGSRRRRVLWWLAAALGVVVLAGAIFYVGFDDANTHERLRQTAASLEQSRHTVTLVDSKLAHDQTDLRNALEQITSLNGQVSRLQTRITTLERTLGAAAVALTAQGTEIIDLKTCLSGVLTASTEAARGDYSAAIAELDSVTAVCTMADRTLG